MPKEITRKDIGVVCDSLAVANQVFSHLNFGPFVPMYINKKHIRKFDEVDALIGVINLDDGSPLPDLEVFENRNIKVLNLNAKHLFSDEGFGKMILFIQELKASELVLN